MKIDKMFDYPSICLEASSISNNIQRRYLLCLKLYFVLLLISGFILFYCNDILLFKIINSICAIAIVVFSFIFHLYDFQGKWYAARAVAESIKTLSWRYALKAEPFIDDESSKPELIKRMKHIVDMNHEFKTIISSTCCTLDPIPTSMCEIRNLCVDERKQYYHKYRVIDQLQWYKSKSDFNRRKANGWFLLLIVISLIITVVLFLDIAIGLEFPVSILLSLVSIIFTWIQTKKYKELNISYAIAAHEIGFISGQLKESCTEMDLNNYVINTENAFSREHTQWLARKDN